MSIEKALSQFDEKDIQLVSDSDCSAVSRIQDALEMTNKPPFKAMKRLPARYVVVNLIKEFL